MSTTDYFAGTALLVIVGAPLLWSARRIRVRLLPDWIGSVAVLADLVVFLSLLMLLLQILGTVGLFRRVPIALASVLTGAATLVWSRNDRPALVDADVGVGVGAGVEREPVTSEPDRRRYRRAAVFACVAIALAAAPWVLRTWSSLHSGVTGADSMYYHLPFAADFAQSGHTTSLHYGGYIDETPFDPENSEMLHALSMVMYQRDLLSPVINLAWFAMAALAGWCVGRSRGVAPATLAAVALFLAGPLFVLYDAGQATNDIVDMALLLALVALVMNSKGRLPAMALAAAAAGLGLSNKLSLIVPIAAVTLAVIVWTERKRRWPVVRVWFPCLALTGSYWYLRNLARTGSPLPSVRIGIGPLALPHVELTADSTAVSHYILQGDAWHRFFLPGARSDFGSVWPVTLALVAVGLGLCLFSRDRILRALAAVSAVCLAAYVFTPATAAGPFVAALFRINLRFAYPGLVLGLVLLPMAPVLRARRYQTSVTLALTALVVGTQASYLHALRPSATLVTYVIAALVFGALLFVARSGSSSARMARIGGAAAMVLLVGATVGTGWAVKGAYFDGRYRNGGGSTVLPHLGVLYRWANHEKDARIGFAGFVEAYPLYGPDLSNRVELVGSVAGNGQLRFPASCRAWRSAVNAGHYDYLALGPLFPSSRVPREYKWTLGDPAVNIVATDGTATVFRVRGRLQPDGCGRN